MSENLSNHQISVNTTKLVPFDTMLLLMERRTYNDVHLFIYFFFSLFQPKLHSDLL